ncbi:DUF3768 domain-containing protein [Sphingobium yanoikuyae]|uniref:DUF3768 domain-containing protein n=1 Tax=Sphingobium yanoikuyae TaxID=13690 RepID=A0A3G2UN18_SPHYA|nr:DUF3768 domain-containing protein [Sphingobium yanoikuyae]AYO75934.1 DUF3768 domain-containing protein [Sphingobium yanoikuyae]
MTQLALSAPAATDRTAAIAALNDAARAGTLVTSRMVLTRALADLLAGSSDDPAILQVRLFQGQCALKRLINETPIDPGNDPHGERDFGVVEYLGHKIFWKIDVYANDGTFAWGTDKPWDGAESFRLVTIMLATDY